MKRLRKTLKWTGIILLVVIVTIAMAVSMRQDLKFDAPYPDIHASGDSAIIAKGKYLFYGPAHCMDCHSNRSGRPDVTDLNSLPPSGGFAFRLPVGTIYTPNITSDKETGIGLLTDAEIARTLRYGVGSDGRAILDFMPFHNTSDEDLQAIISFLRTLPPVKNEVPPMELNVLGKVVKAFLIKPVGPEGEVAQKVEKGITVEYGAYLANHVANCKGCHTNRNLMTGEYIGEPFAGGLMIKDDNTNGVGVVSRNLTPDAETGHIYHWSQEQFINRFRQGKLIPESPMPWEPFKSFSDEDLKAIYVYLNSLKPVNNDAGPVLVFEENKAGIAGD